MASARYSGIFTALILTAVAAGLGVVGSGKNAFYTGDSMQESIAYLDKIKAGAYSGNDSIKALEYMSGQRVKRTDVIADGRVLPKEAEAQNILQAGGIAFDMKGVMGTFQRPVFNRERLLAIKGASGFVKDEEDTVFDGDSGFVKGRPDITVRNAKADPEVSYLEAAAKAQAKKNAAKLMFAVFFGIAVFSVFIYYLVKKMAV